MPYLLLLSLLSDHVAVDTHSATTFLQYFGPICWCVVVVFFIWAGLQAQYCLPSQLPRWEQTLGLMWQNPGGFIIFTLSWSHSHTWGLHTRSRAYSSKSWHAKTTKKSNKLCPVCLATHIHNFAEISHPLYDITQGGQHLAMTDQLTWTPDAEETFADIKQALTSLKMATQKKKLTNKGSDHQRSTLSKYN